MENIIIFPLQMIFTMMYNNTSTYFLLHHISAPHFPFQLCLLRYLIPLLEHIQYILSVFLYIFSLSVVYVSHLSYISLPVRRVPVSLLHRNLFCVFPVWFFCSISTFFLLNNIKIPLWWCLFSSYLLFFWKRMN